MLLTEHLSPVIAALACCAIVILVSNSFSANRKFLFQSSIFAAGLAASFAYLLTNKDSLQGFIDAFTRLPQELRLVLSVFIITSTYFGGALYVGVVSPSVPANDATTFPACCDNSTEIEVPDHLPADDTKLFEDVFKRFTKKFTFILTVSN